MIREYKCVGGPLDGQTISIDRDNAPIYSPPLELKGTVTYTMLKSNEDGEWYLVWDGDMKVRIQMRPHLNRGWPHIP